MGNENYKKIHNMTYVLLLMIIGCGLLIRAKYSFNQSDESFYMSLVHRLWRGDKLIVDEWHPTQFYSFILLPFYSVYRWIVPGGEGVILFFRYISCIMAVGCALFVYGTMDKRSECKGFWAFAMALTLMLYTKSNILGVSYNNTCTYLFTLVFIILSMEETRINRIAAGVLTALGVLCMPYMAVPVIIYLICLIIRKKHFVMYFVGMLGTALVYIPICFPIRNIKAIMDNFKYIFEDPEHSGGYFYFLGKTWWSFRNFNNRFVLYAFMLFCVGLFIYLLKGGKLSQKFKSVLLLVLCFGAVVLSGLKGFRNPGYPAIALTVWTVPIFIVNSFEKKVSSLNRFLLYGGLVIALAYAGGSDTKLNGTTTGFTITAVAAIMAIATYVKALEKPFVISGKCILAVLLGFMLLARIMIVVRDSDLKNLNCRLETGPGAGLYTTAEHKAEYQEIMLLLEDISAKHSGENLFCTKILPWAYLAADCQVGAPTAWRTELSSPLLEEYYGLHPDRIPQVVVVFKDKVGAYDTCSFNGKKGNDTPNENETEGVLWEYMISEGYEALDTEVAIVYTKP